MQVGSTFRFGLVVALAAVFALGLTWAASAIAEPVEAPHGTVELIPLEQGIKPGSSLEVGLHFKLEPGWHIYWSNAGDSGLPPTMKWTLPQGMTAGALNFPTPKRLPLGPLMDYGYEDEVLFPVLISTDTSLKPGKSVDILAKADWLVCRERCIPGKANLKLTLPVTTEKPAGNGPAVALFERFQSELPKPLPADAKAVFAPTKKGFRVQLLTGKRETAAQFFPFEVNQIDNPAPQKVQPLAKGVEIELKKDENLSKTPDELAGIVVLADGRSYEIHARSGSLAASGVPGVGLPATLRFVGLAFIGGIILNLMPCVFPVLFIKGLSLVQSSNEERGYMRRHGLVYTLGILVSFWAVVAVLLLLRVGGRQLGWGFQFQSPTFVALMALLLFFLGLSLAGQFEIGLSLTSAGGSLANHTGYAGSFFTGILAMVVATPCTAPFMGAAIGFALAQPAGMTFAIFTALALGLAAPYLLLSSNPAWTRLLPRPGAWMEVLKQATAVPVFATVIWLVWVFTQSAGVNAMMGLLAALLLLAVAGWIMGRWPAKRLPTAFATVVIALAIASPVYAIRTFGAAGVSAKPGGDTGEWQAFTPAALQRYRAEGKPVFVDFTASWCLSCQVNERVVLQRDDVKQRLKDSGVVLMKADWTQRDETIARTLNDLGRNGVPTYALYPGSTQDAPQVLPEVLTPGVLFDALDILKQQKQAGLNSSSR